MSGPDKKSAADSDGAWNTFVAGIKNGDLGAMRNYLTADHPVYYADPDRDDVVIAAYMDGRRQFVRFDNDGEHVVGSPDDRSWQLALTGHGLEYVTAQARHDMARVLDLLPSVSHLTVEVSGEIIHVTRDWSGNRFQEADRLLDRIARSDGISAIVLPATGDTLARRVSHD